MKLIHTSLINIFQDPLKPFSAVTLQVVSLSNLKSIIKNPLSYSQISFRYRADGPMKASRSVHMLCNPTPRISRQCSHTLRENILGVLKPGVCYPTFTRYLSLLDAFVTEYTSTLWRPCVASWFPRFSFLNPLKSSPVTDYDTTESFFFFVLSDIK